MVVELKICIFWPLRLQFLEEPFPEIFQGLKSHSVIWSGLSRSVDPCSEELTEVPVIGRQLV